MSQPEVLPGRSRLQALDALRGFDMLWIIGAETIVHQLARWQRTPWLEAWATQLSHVHWEGLRAYDLIFPLFMFLAGVAIPFSFESRRERGESRAVMVRKILIRTVVLVVLGMIYNGLLSDQPGPPRLPSVLGQIGIGWGVAAFFQLLVRSPWKQGMAALAVVLLITLLQLVVPVPPYGAGVLTPTGAINTWLDRLLMPGRLYGKTFDPEGLLCIFSACSLTLAGTAAGSWLRKAGVCTWRTCGGLFIAGCVLTTFGALAWRLGYPPIKALWTGTFDLLALGISLSVFAVFLAIIDVLRWQRWSVPLQIIGMNSLTIYLLSRFFDFDHAAALLFGRLANGCGNGQATVLATATVLLEWLLLWFLFRKKIFLRV